MFDNFFSTKWFKLTTNNTFLSHIYFLEILTSEELEVKLVFHSFFIPKSTRKNKISACQNPNLTSVFSKSIKMQGTDQKCKFGDLILVGQIHKSHCARQQLNKYFITSYDTYTCEILCINSVLCDKIKIIQFSTGCMIKR